MQKIRRWSALLMVMGAVGGCARSDALHKTGSLESDNIELTKVDYKLDGDQTTAAVYFLFECGFAFVARRYQIEDHAFDFVKRDAGE